MREKERERGGGEAAAATALTPTLPRPPLLVNRYCPFYKTVGMLRNIAAFHEAATAAVERGGVAAAGAASGGDAPKRVPYALIKARLGDLLHKIGSQKFEDPSQGEASLRAKLAALREEIRERFRALEEEVR